MNYHSSASHFGIYVSDLTLWNLGLAFLQYKRAQLFGHLGGSNTMHYETLAVTSIE